MVLQADVLLVNGGDRMYLHHWMRQSHLADLFPTLQNFTHVSLSAGSMIMAPDIGEDFVRWQSLSGNDETLGMIDLKTTSMTSTPSLRSSPWIDLGRRTTNRFFPIRATEYS